MIQLNDIGQSEVDASKLTHFWSEGNKIICDFNGCKDEYISFEYKNKECLLGDYDKLSDITGL